MEGHVHALEHVDLSRVARAAVVVAGQSPPGAQHSDRIRRRIVRMRRGEQVATPESAELRLEERGLNALDRIASRHCVVVTEREISPVASAQPDARA